MTRASANYVANVHFNNLLNANITKRVLYETMPNRSLASDAYIFHQQISTLFPNNFIDFCFLFGWFFLRSITKTLSNSLALAHYFFVCIEISKHWVWLLYNGSPDPAQQKRNAEIRLQFFIRFASHFCAWLYSLRTFVCWLFSSLVECLLSFHADLVYNRFDSTLWCYSLSLPISYPMATLNVYKV